MFEFAISQHQKRRPTKRVYACWAASCVLHVIALMLLIRYPQLISPGLNRWFRQPALLARLFSQENAEKSSDWRTVTFVGKSSNAKLTTPSAATLRKYMYNWNRKPEGVPPVRVRWGGEKGGPTTETAKAPTKPVLGTKEPQPSPEEKPVAAANPHEPATSGGGGEGGAAAGAQAVRGTGTAYLPAPQPGSVVKEAPKTAEISPNAAPASIPSGISQPVTSTASPAAKPAQQTAPKSSARTFEDEQKAIHTEGTGLFGTMGFPLGEYANLVIERVKGNWLIPSNLRKSQGRTTVIFYIDRDGRFTNARIITSSGSSSLDLAALNAVIESNPFPPLPKGFPGDHVGAKFVFSYNERQ